MKIVETLQQYEWLIAPLIPAAIVLGIILAIAGTAARRAAAFSLPRPTTAPLVRWGETVLWCAGLVLFLISFRSQFSDYVRNPNTVPALPAEVGRRTTIVALCCLPIVMATVFRRVRWAASGLAILAAFTAVSWQSAYQWPVVEAAVLNSPLPFTIATPAGLPAVTVTANGVPLGTTPVVTTWEELKARTPVWKVESEFHRQTGQGTLVWCPLSVHTHVSGRPATPPERDEKQLFLRYHLGEQPLYLYDLNSFKWTGFIRTNFSGAGGQTNSGMRSNGQIFPFHIEPLLTIPAWGDDVQFLLHRARLTDYVVDDAWCAAFESYGELGERALIGLTIDDPALQRVTEVLAKRLFPRAADQVTEGEAWDRMLAMIDEAGRRGEFQFAGYEGAAVRQLAAGVSDLSFAERAAAELSHTHFESGRSIETHSLWVGHVSMIRISPRDGKLDGRWLRAHVLPALAVERDTALDAVAPEPDNPIEVHVTPALMRQHRVGDGAERRIGGHAYEQALSRHDWHSQPPDPQHWDDAEHIFGATVNRWLKLLGELDTAFGREFRVQHQYEFIELAQEIWTHEPTPSSLPESLDFLFREHHADLPQTDKDPKTLAEMFWYSFTERRPRFGDTREELTMRWNYLARMAPDSQPQQFVKALRELNPQWMDSQAAECLKLMPLESALATLSALLAEIEHESTTRKDLPPGRSFPQDRSLLIYAALTMDNFGVADVVAAELERQDTNFNRRTLEGALREGRVSATIMQRLTTNKRPGIRKAVAETGLYRTSPSARLMVEQLSRDPDESVRIAAQGVIQEWAEWSARPLPSRVMPNSSREAR